MHYNTFGEGVAMHINCNCLNCFVVSNLPKLFVFQCPTSPLQGIKLLEFGARGRGGVRSLEICEGGSGRFFPGKF